MTRPLCVSAKLCVSARNTRHHPQPPPLKKKGLFHSPPWPGFAFVLSLLLASSASADIRLLGLAFGPLRARAIRRGALAGVLCKSAPSASTPHLRLARRSPDQCSAGPQAHALGAFSAMARVRICPAAKCFAGPRRRSSPLRAEVGRRSRWADAHRLLTCRFRGKRRR